MKQDERLIGCSVLPSQSLKKQRRNMLVDTLNLKKINFRNIHVYRLTHSKCSCCAKFKIQDLLKNVYNVPKTEPKSQTDHSGSIPYTKE